jgi:hypothetical protein
LQRAQLLNDQEPEDDSGPDRAEEVLQALPEAHAAQRSEVIEDFRLKILDLPICNLKSAIFNEDRGVSSTVKLPVSKTGLGGSNPSAPASFGMLDGKLGVGAWELRQKR